MFLSINFFNGFSGCTSRDKGIVDVKRNALSEVGPIVHPYGK
jgi:hypothetical protein